MNGSRVRRRVLVSWIALNNDPYERERSGSFRLVDGQLVPGPTLTLLLDPESPYVGSVSDFVLFHSRSTKKGETRQSRAVDETLRELKVREPSLRVHLELWDGSDPTDHAQLFQFLRVRLLAVRNRFAGRELVVHVSPGTPSMQTVLVLMGETGFIEQPFILVKSYRKEERGGRPAVVPVQLGIETYYKAYRAARPSEVSSEDASLVWDPARFRSSRLKAVFAEARRFARLNVPVLLLGERGTGKTTLAGWIRTNSPYRRAERDDNWPAVACGQYTPETMRAELFGYRRGSFTGALSDRAGLLAAAHKETLFLDEVGDVSKDLQRLLIKAIEEKRYMRLGDDRLLESDFRLISATNLDDETLHQRLDPDFLDRISVLSLRLPALREIPEELPWLWQLVFSQAIHSAGVGMVRLPVGVHRGIVERLGQHPLPGNLRDLFRLAYRILSARDDGGDPFDAEAAALYGLEALESVQNTVANETMPKAVSRAFAESRRLDSIIPPGKVLATKAVERALKAYMANEVRRLAKERGTAADSLCDVTDRALREWVSAHDKDG
jgi:DNA-binding NtrC family response regulator